MTMNLVRLHNLQNRLNPTYAPLNDRLDDLFAGFFRPVTSATAASTTDIKLDVREDDKAYFVTASLPGVKKEDIHLAVEGKDVTLEVEVKREFEQKQGERTLLSERFYGKTSRAFTLAQDIDDAAVDAKYVDGVLTFTLPKKQTVAAKRVTIN
jgi:HSP20 family protein